MVDVEAPEEPTYGYERRADGVVAVWGELDWTAAASLRLVLLESAEPVILDLTRVEFMDSMGVSALLAAKRHRPLTIAAMSAPVDKLLKILGLATHFD